MAIGHTKREPGLGKQLVHGFAGGAAQSLGKAAGEAISGGIGAGVKKIGEKLGVGSPDKAMLDLIIEKGYAKDRESAKQWLKLNPRAQQADIAAAGEQQKAAQDQEKWQELAAKEGQSPEEVQEFQMPAEIDEDIVQMASDPNTTPEQLAAFIQERNAQNAQEAAQEEAAGLGKPEFAENPKNIYRRERALGLNHKEAKEAADFESKFNEPRLKKAEAYVDKESQALEAAEEEKSRYKRVYNVDTKEGLPTAQVAGFIRSLEKTFGLNEGDLNSILGAPAEEVTKILADTIKDAKSVFGSRVTDADLAAWFKRLPSLLQTSEGRLRALGDLYTFAELKELKAQATKDIVKKYKGKIPLDIERRVDHKIQKQRNKLLDMFENGKSNLPGFDKNLKKAAKKTSKERTGGLVGGVVAGLGGSALGATGGRLLGGGLGSVLGPVGTTLGALGGGYAGGKLGAMGGAALGSLVPGALKGLGGGKSPSKYGIEPGIQGLFGQGPVA